MIDKLLLSVWPEGSLENSINLACLVNIISSFLIYFISSSKKERNDDNENSREKEKKREHILNIFVDIYFLNDRKINIIKIY